MLCLLAWAAALASWLLFVHCVCFACPAQFFSFLSINVRQTAAETCSDCTSHPAILFATPSVFWIGGQEKCLKGQAQAVMCAASSRKAAANALGNWLQTEIQTACPRALRSNKSQRSVGITLQDVGKLNELSSQPIAPFRV